MVKKGMFAHKQFPYGPHKPGQGGTAGVKRKPQTPGKKPARPIVDGQNTSKRFPPGKLQSPSLTVGK